MWTSTLDLDLKRTLLTRLLGRFWSGAYFSSFAPLRIQQIPRQSLVATNWVRVRNRLAGINGSDLQLLTANGDLRVAPATLPQYKHLYPGQEVVGEVIEVGDDVQRLRVGDRVVLRYTANCLASGLDTLCRSCAAGCYNLCENSTLPAPTQIGGGWSEEMLIPEQQLARATELPVGRCRSPQPRWLHRRPGAAECGHADRPEVPSCFTARPARLLKEEIR